MTSNNSTPNSVFQLNTDREMITYGNIYFVISTPLLPLIGLLMKTVQAKNNANSNVTYKLMNIINFCQLGQSVTHFLSGPMLIFPVLLSRINPLITVFGSLLNSFWIGDFPFMTLLAVCRILIFSNTMQLDKFPILIKILLFSFISWVLMLFLFGAVTQNFCLSTPSWDYDYETIGVEFFEIQEVIISFSCLVLSYFAYIFMAYLIYAKKSISSNVQSRKNEIIILAQSTFVTAYITLLIFLYHQSMFSIEILDLTVKRNQAFMNLGLIFHCYVNPTLTLVCNKSIREEFMFVVGYKKRPISKKSTISVNVSKASTIQTPRRNLL